MGAKIQRQLVIKMNALDVCGCIVDLWAAPQESAREPDQRVLDVGGDIRMGSAIDASMMHAITWRPLV
jgi:hypothetical protein